MTEHPKTIGQTMAYPDPTWYTTKNFAGGVSHLYTERNHGSITTLCGMSNEAGEPSQTAKHCVSCTTRLKAFVEAATVEHEWVIETVTIQVVRPAQPDETARERVGKAVERKRSWDTVSLKSDIKPFVPVDPDATQPPEPIVIPDEMIGSERVEFITTNDHVHDSGNRCVKDRSGHCRVPVSPWQVQP